MTGGSDLRRWLVAIGRVAGGRGESGGVRFGALVLATVVLGVGLLTVVAVHAGYAGVSERTQARLGIEAGKSDDSDSIVHIDTRQDELADGRVYEVVVVDPGRKAPIPPGVREWPGPGEVLLTPALLEAGAAEGIEERYGNVVGTIGSEGVTDPNERMAYVGSPVGLDPDAADVAHVVGFGKDLEAWAVGGYHAEDRPEWSMQSLVIGLFVLPGLALMLVAARTGSHARDRRLALVTALGARGRDRAWLSVGEAWRPIAVGAVGTAMIAAIPMTVDVPIPVTGYVLSSGDMRGSVVGVLSAVLGAMGLMFGAVVWANRHRRPRRSRRFGASTRPVGSARPLTWAWAALCPVMIFTAMFLPDLVFTPRTSLHTRTGWAGTLGTAVTLPAMIAMATVVCGHALARWGKRRRAAGWLVAGRRTATHSGPTGRMIAGITIGIFLFLQAVGWQSLFAEHALGADRMREVVGDSAAYIELEGPLAAVEQTRDFIDSLPEHTVVLARTDSEIGEGADLREKITIHGSCEELRSLDVPCDGSRIGPSELPVWLRAEVFGILPGSPQDDVEHFEEAIDFRVAETDDVAAMMASVDDDDPVNRMYLVDERDRGLDVHELKQVAYRTLPAGAEINLVQPGGGAGYAAALEDQSKWALLFGVIAVTVMAAAAGLSGAAEFVRHGRALAPLTVLTGGVRVFRTAAAWAVSLPMCLAIVVSLGVGTWFAEPLDRAGFISPELLATVLVITVALSAVMSVWAGQVAVRQARRWRPSGTD